MRRMINGARIIVNVLFFYDATAVESVHISLRILRYDKISHNLEVSISGFRGNLSSFSSMCPQ